MPITDEIKKFIKEVGSLLPTTITEQLNRLSEPASKVEQIDLQTINEDIRVNLTKLLTNSDNSDLKQTIYDFLLVLAESFPINLDDPISSDAINAGDEVFISSGNQFSLSNLVKWHNTRDYRGSSLRERPKEKYLLNPLTNQSFSELDRDHIIKIAKEKQIEIKDLIVNEADRPSNINSPVNSYQNMFQLLSPLEDRNPNLIDEEARRFPLPLNRQGRNSNIEYYIRPIRLPVVDEVDLPVVDEAVVDEVDEVDEFDSVAMSRSIDNSIVMLSLLMVMGSVDVISRMFALYNNFLPPQPISPEQNLPDAPHIVIDNALCINYLTGDVATYERLNLPHLAQADILSHQAAEAEIAGLGNTFILETLVKGYQYGLRGDMLREHLPIEQFGESYEHFLLLGKLLERHISPLEAVLEVKNLDTNEVQQRLSGIYSTFSPS